MRALLIFLLVLTHAANTVSGQDTSFPELPHRFYKNVSQKADHLHYAIDKKNSKIIRKLQKLELRSIRSLYAVDSLLANERLADSKVFFNKIQSRYSTIQNTVSGYIPGLDTMLTALKFIRNGQDILKHTNKLHPEISKAAENLGSLRDQFGKAEELKQLLNERKGILKNWLSSTGSIRQLKKLNKDMYYYSQQLQEYKSIINEPDKIEQKAIQLLMSTNLFKGFMKQNGFLASIFPGATTGSGISPGQQTGFAALQTREQMNTYFEQSGLNVSNINSRIQENLQPPASALDQLRNQLEKKGANPGEPEMPELKPNSQKTKTFWQRIELGSNFQAQRSRQFFPATTDLGLTLGYRLNDNSIAGIGFAYKAGLGEGWNKIKISHQGIGFRSFLDYKIKGQIWISGGYEKNYKPGLNNPVLRAAGIDRWEDSGILGLTKSVELKGGIIKKAKLQVLWDFLSYSQRPRPSPILFRIGYSF